MSMPKIPDFNPDINISREDAINLIIASVAMEELSLAHILNAEGEKIQYFLGTLDNRNPGEVTMCDIMAVNKSVQKTLRNATKAEMLLSFKLEDAMDLDNMYDMACRTTITGRKVWLDENNLYKTRPDSVVINLLRDGVVYKSATVGPAENWRYTFSCLPIRKDSSQKYVYQIEEPEVPSGYETTTDGYNVINKLTEVIITGTKMWVDEGDEDARPPKITVNLLQNGNQFLSVQVDSPAATQYTSKFSFTKAPVFDNAGNPFVYTLDEVAVPDYKKSIEGFVITNTIDI